MVGGDGDGKLYRWSHFHGALMASSSFLSDNPSADGIPRRRRQLSNGGGEIVRSNFSPNINIVITASNAIFLDAHGKFYFSLLPRLVNNALDVASGICSQYRQARNFSRIQNVNFFQSIVVIMSSEFHAQLLSPRAQFERCRPKAYTAAKQKLITIAKSKKFKMLFHSTS